MGKCQFLYSVLEAIEAYGASAILAWCVCHILQRLYLVNLIVRESIKNRIASECIDDMKACKTLSQLLQL